MSTSTYHKIIEDMSGISAADAVAGLLANSGILWDED